MRLGGQHIGKLPANGFDGGEVVTCALDHLRQFSCLVDPNLRLESELLLRRDVGQSVDNSDAASVLQEDGAVFCVTNIWPGADVADVWFVSDRGLRFRFQSSLWQDDASLTCRCYQYEPRAARLVTVGEHPVGKAEIEFADAMLLNPFLPVLMAITNQDGRLIGTSLLPFPSLCRGGVHYAELIAVSREVDQLSNVQTISLTLLRSLLEGGAGRAPLALGHIQVDLRGATGAEPIFSIDVREWLESVMNIGCSPAEPADIDHPDVRTFLEQRLAAPSIDTSSGSSNWVHRRHGEGQALVIPYDALPSLHALVAQDNILSIRRGVTVGGFAVASSGTARPAWAVVLPSMGEELLALQPRHSAVGIPFLRRLEDTQDVTTVPAWPLAIRFVDFDLSALKAALLMPVAPDISGPLLCRELPKETSITVVIPSCGARCDGFIALIESLQLQTISGRVDVVAILESPQREARTLVERALSRHFDGRYQIVEYGEGNLSAQLDRVLEFVHGDNLLLIQSNVVLHDSRTLETLGTMVAQDGVASAGCMLVRPGLNRKEPDVVCQSGGFFLTPKSEGISGGGELLERECYELFPSATYPVAANSWALHMMRTATPKALGGFAPASGDGMDLAARASNAGMVHLCTSIVSAGIRLDVPSPPTLVHQVPIGSDPSPAAAPVIRKLNG